MEVHGGMEVRCWWHEQWIRDSGVQVGFGLLLFYTARRSDNAMNSRIYPNIPPRNQPCCSFCKARRLGAGRRREGCQYRHVRLHAFWSQSLVAAS